ncbi:DUF7019 family protein [Streptomyces sp. NPDC053542]|uniref:DUF7019 family protein n=1 Tax=Streptomyces sp. NPDC053542 TaxID=3365710 RepID=UPI0037D620EA
MRYYLYLSDAKLDMLFEQIPRKLLPRLVTEAKVDLKVVSFSVQRPQTELSRYDRLEIVEAYLEREYDVGWMTEPAFWFRGESGLRVSGADGAGGPVLMTGTDSDPVVVLIGSAHHVMGGEQPSPELGRVGHSWLPSLHRLLENSRPGPRSMETPSLDTRSLDDRGTLRDSLAFAQQATGPAIWCEFLARQLMRGTVTGEEGRTREVVIGTPLYVAMCDEIQAP